MIEELSQNASADATAPRLERGPSTPRAQPSAPVTQDNGGTSGTELSTQEGARRQLPALELSTQEGARRQLPDSIGTNPASVSARVSAPVSAPHPRDASASGVPSVEDYAQAVWDRWARLQASSAEAPDEEMESLTVGELKRGISMVQDKLAEKEQDVMVEILAVRGPDQVNQ